MRGRLRSLLLRAAALTVAVGTSGITRDARAQAADSAATLAVFRVIADALPPVIASGVWQTGSTPWRISVPADTGRVAWSVVAGHLGRVLQARDTSAADTRRSVFRIESFTMRADSVVLEFYIGGQFRCPDGWRGSGTWYAGAVRLHWGVPGGSVRPTKFEDSLGC